jgi:hypothetical protein
VTVASLFATAAAVAALAAPPGQFTLDRAVAQPNDHVTMRGPATRQLRVYLVPEAALRSTFGRHDRRLAFVGSLVRGRLVLSVPPLDDGTYALATWCRTCGFAVLRTGPRLRIAARSACPVTLPNGNRPPGQPRNVTWYGNGLLWAGAAPNGTRVYGPEDVAEDGSVGDKLLWVTTPPWEKPVVSGERIDDDAPPLRVERVNTGSFSGAANPSHMTPVSFPSAGCWRLTARVGDVSLVYVVEVVVRG